MAVPFKIAVKVTFFNKISSETERPSYKLPVQNKCKENQFSKNFQWSIV